jgi:hypothetical protein
LDKLSKTFLSEVDRKTSFDFNLLTDNDSLVRHKKELLEYNLQDCVSLYKILEQFYDLIMKEFNINIINYSTLPGLAFAIYRSKFMPVTKVQKDIKDKEGNLIRTVVNYISKISITPHKLYKELYSGYIGGHVDVFKTWSSKWKLIYCYDVNSLYPSVMRDYSFPIGNPIYVDNMQDWESKFGIFCAKVICPDNLNMPLLMIHRKGNSIAPVGTWTGWYTSVELLKAKALGYTIEVNKGYIFEKGEGRASKGGIVLTPPAYN